MRYRMILLVLCSLATVCGAREAEGEHKKQAKLMEPRKVVGTKPKERSVRFARPTVRKARWDHGDRERRSRRVAGRRRHVHSCACGH